MSDFKRKDKYIVIKRKDLTGKQLSALMWVGREHEIETVESVVVEHDWPMYEDVWSMIQKYVETGKHTSIAELKAAHKAALQEAFDIGVKYGEQMSSVYEADFIAAKKTFKLFDELRSRLEDSDDE